MAVVVACHCCIATAYTHSLRNAHSYDTPGLRRLATLFHLFLLAAMGDVILLIATNPQRMHKKCGQSIAQLGTTGEQCLAPARHCRRFRLPPQRDARRLLRPAGEASRSSSAVFSCRQQGPAQRCQRCGPAPSPSCRCLQGAGSDWQLGSEPASMGPRAETTAGGRTPAVGIRSRQQAASRCCALQELLTHKQTPAPMAHCW